MGKQRVKYLKKIGGKKGYKVKDAVIGILSSDFSDLDIKKLSGKKNLRRCRVGNIRILYQLHESGKTEIIAIKPRGDVY